MNHEVRMMNPTAQPRKITLRLLPALLLLLDRATKYAALHYLPDGGLLWRWGGMVGIKNTGIAFSFPLPVILLIIILALAVISICTWLYLHWSSGNTRQVRGMLLILTGALSNIIDRLWYGGVVDIFYLPFWATFNLADVGIVIGAGLVVFKKTKGRG